METKLIRFKDHEENMTFEDCYEKFTWLRNTIYKKWNDKNLDLDPVDMESQINLFFWKAYKNYKPETKIAFSTYTYYTLSGGLKRLYRDTHQAKRYGKPIYMEDEAYNSDNSIRIEDMISSTYNVEDIIIIKLSVQAVLKSLNDSERKRVMALIKTGNQVKAGELLGIRQTHISRAKTTFIKRFYEELAV